MVPPAMPDVPLRPLALCAILALTSRTAQAELPEPRDFDLTYFVTDANGERARQMGEADHLKFINRARCECGQQITAKISARLPGDDTSIRFNALIGTMCDNAEAELASEYRWCGTLIAALVPMFEQGFERSFHPAFLAHGVEPQSSHRIDDPETALKGACDGKSEGSAGLWVCKPGENNFSGCQQEEFFISPDSALATLSGLEPLHYDFAPPVARPSDLSVEPGNGAVQLTWSLPTSGDIHGLRVLCEEADTGAAPGFDLPTPTVTAVADGTHYFTAHNLCGDQPFSTVQVTDPPPPADPGTCGDNLLDPGEACDDGPDNGPDGLCAPDCRLRVSPDLHRLDWTHLCSGHIEFDQDTVVIGGLKNGTSYNFVLVAHDDAGNPRPLAHVVTATPDASLPDLLPAADDGCGCTTSPSGHALSAMSLFIIIPILRRRRRPRL